MLSRLNIPSASDGITLRQFIDYQNASDDMEKCMVIIGKGQDYVKSLKIETVSKIIEIFDNALKRGAATEIHKVGKLGMIPDLTAMSLGEYIDLETFGKTAFIDGNVVGSEVLKMLCVLYRPISIDTGKFYRIEKYDCDNTYTYEDKVMEITMDVVNSVLLFFSSLEKELSMNSLRYLSEELKKQMTLI